MTNHSSQENQIQYVTNFQELVGTPFQGDINAICWARQLRGDFNEIIRKVATNGNITVVEEEELLRMQLSEQGALARETLLQDFQLLTAYGASPTLNVITHYDRDETVPFFPTDVYSFHVDRAPFPPPPFYAPTLVHPAIYYQTHRASRRSSSPKSGLSSENYTTARK